MYVHLSEVYHCMIVYDQVPIVRACIHSSIELMSSIKDMHTLLSFFLKSNYVVLCHMHAQYMD